jgi:hypothetical protein
MIKETRIKQNLKKFAFPRLSGTQFELKAFNEVKQEVENLNLDFEIQNFTFSSFYSRIYPKIAFLSGSLIFLTLYLNLHLIISLIFILILLSILIVSFIITRRPEKIQLKPKFNSQNLIVKIEPNSDDLKNNNRILLFMSHLDSKGQRFKVRIRIRIMKLWIISSIILTLITILKTVMSTQFELIFYLIGLFPLILNIFASVMIILNSTNNQSQGAIDNASGIACNLELLNYYSIPENRLKNYNMLFLFSGAEECGTMGVRHFYYNLDNFDPDKSIIFNFESIASNVFLFPGGMEGVHARDVNNWILNNSRYLKVHHFITNRIFGTHSDGGFLGNKGFQGYGIGGAEVYDYMHTPNDTIDKVNTKVLKKMCLVLTDSLKKHDSNFFK